MDKLRREDLMSLEVYSEQRPAFRARVMEHKSRRKLHVGPNVTLVFEDRLTIQYQIQEMLRAERIFDREGIQDELDAYNPLIPDGSNWKVTMMIEYPDPEERKRELKKLKGIEDRTWVQVEGHERVMAIADEDLERENEEKTSSVHFLRFELTPAMIESIRRGAKVRAGIDHEAYRTEVEMPAEVAAALSADFD